MKVLAIIKAVEAEEQLLLVLKTGTPERPSSVNENLDLDKHNHSLA